MTMFRGSLVLVCALALGGACSSSPMRNNGNSGGEGGEGGEATGGKGTGGKGTGGSTASTGGSTGSTGGSTGSTGGSTGSTGGSTGSTGGSTGTGGSAADAGADGPPSSGGKFTITVDGIMMGDRLCFKKEASNSGGNHSPKIEWMNPPAGTMSYVLTMYDQTNMTPHRIVCNIPPTETGQAADIGTMVPMGAETSTGHTKPNDMWYGPGAGGNAHSYEIAIWALATPKLEGGCTVDGAAGTRAVMDKLRKAPATLVLAHDAKVLWGNVNGQCTP